MPKEEESEVEGELDGLEGECIEDNESKNNVELNEQTPPPPADNEWPESLVPYIGCSGESEDSFLMQKLTDIIC